MKDIPSIVPVTGIWPSQKCLPSEQGAQSFKNPRATFCNPFEIEDLLVFNDLTLQKILVNKAFHLLTDYLGSALQNTSNRLIQHIERNLSPETQPRFRERLQHPLPDEERRQARKRILDALFWELIYWQKPELYDELTVGEQLHPAIFETLRTDIRGKAVLDIAAGTGRATLEALRHQPEQLYAVDPSPNMLAVLEKKLAHIAHSSHIILSTGYFEQLPLADNSVDLALTCSAFTSKPEQKGEASLAELRRVTRSGGKITIISPRPPDYSWLASHNFQYIGFPEDEKATVHFQSLESALRCARLFYAGNQALEDYLLKQRQPEVPYTLLGFHQLHDYCWLPVQK